MYWKSLCICFTQVAVFSLSKMAAHNTMVPWHLRPALPCQPTVSGDLSMVYCLSFIESISSKVLLISHLGCHKMMPMYWVLQRAIDEGQTQKLILMHLWRCEVPLYSLSADISLLVCLGLYQLRILQKGKGRSSRGTVWCYWSVKLHNGKGKECRDMLPCTSRLLFPFYLINTKPSARCSFYAGYIARLFI